MNNELFALFYVVESSCTDVVQLDWIIIDYIGTIVNPHLYS